MLLPFSDATHPGRKDCCMKRFLESALEHPLKCQTCILCKDVPNEVAPLITVNNANMHLLNNHLVVCLICTNKAFLQVWKLEQTNLHVTDCIAKATYNQSRPYVCTSCLQTMWFKPEDK